MGFFSKKITTDKIAESLKEFFNINHKPLIDGLNDSLKDEQEVISIEQNMEAVFVTMFAIIKAILTTFGDTPQTKKIIGKFQQDIFNEYIKDTEERNRFMELFWKRCDEYSEILNPENEDIAIQSGQIFCNHFFGEKEDGSHLTIMLLTGGLFINTMLETKKFLDEILSKFEID